MRPYIVLILNTYGTPISPNWATVALGVTGIVGTITCVLTVKLIGKRRLFLISLIEVILAGYALSKCIVAENSLKIHMTWVNLTQLQVFMDFITCREEPHRLIRKLIIEIR